MGNVFIIADKHCDAFILTFVFFPFFPSLSHHLSHLPRPAAKPQVCLGAVWHESCYATSLSGYLAPWVSSGSTRKSAQRGALRDGQCCQQNRIPYIDMCSLLFSTTSYNVSASICYLYTFNFLQINRIFINI